MTENDTQALFAVARKCPTEISKAEVLDFIQTIPSLPLKPWFKKFNLNSIIMTTTILTIAISALLLFSNQENSTSKKTFDSRNNSESFISVDSSQNQTNSVFHQNFQEALLDSVKEIQGTKSESKAQNQSIETSKISTVDDLNNEQSIKPTHITLTTVLDSLHKLNIQIPTLPVDELKSTSASNQKDQGSIKNYNPFTTNTLNPKIHKRDTINIDELPSIQTKLLDQLLLDRYINSKSEDITLEFSSNGLKVNAKSISKEKLATYVKLLNEYGVKLRNERRIFLNDRFIVLTDKNNGIFRSLASGKKLKFTYRDNNWKSFENDLFRDNAISK